MRPASRRRRDRLAGAAHGRQKSTIDAEVVMAREVGPDFAAEWPRVESNHRTQIRSLPLYPLSYGASPAKGRRDSGAHGPRARESGPPKAPPPRPTWRARLRRGSREVRPSDFRGL